MRTNDDIVLLGTIHRGADRFRAAPALTKTAPAPAPVEPHGTQEDFEKLVAAARSQGKVIDGLHPHLLAEFRGGGVAGVKRMLAAMPDVTREDALKNLCAKADSIYAAGRITRSDAMARAIRENPDLARRTEREQHPRH